MAVPMSPLHYIGEAIRQWLLQVPLGAARGLYLAVLAGLLLWVLLLPRRQRTRGAPSSDLSGNLKVWATFALLIQILIYWLL